MRFVRFLIPHPSESAMFKSLAAIPQRLIESAQRVKQADPKMHPVGTALTAQQRRIVAGGKCAPVSRW